MVTRLLIAGCVALAACARTDAADANLKSASGVTGLRGTPLERPLVKPAFTLTRSDGTPYDFVQETSGKITLLFFGYTHCPDVCPLHMANIAAVLKKMPWEQRDQFRVVFVTTDPERDTPQRISDWLGGFDPAFIGLRGTDKEIERAQESLGLAPASRAAADSNAEYLVGHAAQVFAFGRDGVARVVYPFGTRQDDWAHDLPRLLKGIAQHDTLSPRALGNDRNLAVAPVVIAAAPDGTSGALYLTVVNSGDQPDTLQAVSVIGGPLATLHVTNTNAGSAMMQRVASLEIPARARLEMRPGGVHVMLEGGATPLAPGSSAAVELHFARRGRITALGSIVTYAQLDSVLSLARSALETR